MKKKQSAADQKAAQIQEQPPKPSLSLMAVQEKLGLFKPLQKKQAGDKDHDYLKKKPLGLI